MRDFPESNIRPHPTVPTVQADLVSGRAQIEPTREPDSPRMEPTRELDSPDTMHGSNIDGDMDTNVVETLFSAVALKVPVVDRVDGARHLLRGSGMGGSGSDRASHHSMIGGQIGKVHSAESRSETIGVDKAATARKPHLPRPAFDGGRGSTTCVTGRSTALDCEYPAPGSFCDPARSRIGTIVVEQVDKTMD